MVGSGSSDADATTAVGNSGETPRAHREPRDAASLVGTRVGRYLVIEELGRGGMGLVLRAYDPKLQREVALKKVHSGLLGAEARARMIREARAMAQLAHPNVVAVFDVEVGDDEGVVLVMEYVAGNTLKAWLEGERTWQEIVDAFCRAGLGLQAAHDVELLHRDFKTDNVLVGDDGRIRVTDFGLARAATDRSSSRGGEEKTPSSARLADGVATPLTEAGAVMGTPLYMAPEQHSGAELDPSADQYAFCVALWRALHGSPPFIKEDYKALVKAKFEGPPKWPSGSPVPRHVADAIRRGLSAQPSGRWPTMRALLEELQRDPSRTRFRVIAVGAVATAGLAAWGWQRVEHARAVEACEAEGEAIAGTWTPGRVERITTAFAETGSPYAPEAWARARDRLEVYVDQWRRARVAVCTAADVERTRTAAVSESARTCLDEQHQQLEDLLGQFELPDRGIVQRTGPATAWLPRVEECTDEAQLRIRPVLPDEPGLRKQASQLRAQVSRSALARALGRYEESQEMARGVLEAAQNNPELAPLGSEAKLQLARSVDAVGKHEEASELLQDAYIEAGALGRDDVALEAGIVLVFVYAARLGRPEDAMTWGRLTQMIADRSERGDDIIIAGLYDGLGHAHTQRGEYEEAIELHERALAIQERDLGPDHPQVAVSLMSLGIASLERHDYAASAAYSERALAVREKVLGPQHPHLAGALNNVANAYRQLGRLDDAAAMYERSLEIANLSYGPDSPRSASIHNGLGELHRRRGDFEAALKSYQRCQELLTGAYKPNHPIMAVLDDNLGLTHRGLGDLDKAIALHEKALATRRKVLGDDHPDVAESLQHLGEALLEQSQPRRAVEVLQEALAIREKAEVTPEEREASRVALEQARKAVDGGLLGDG